MAATAQSASPPSGAHGPDHGSASPHSPSAEPPRVADTIRCTATTRTGNPCKKRPMAGHEVCQPHSGGQVGRRSKLTDDSKREILDAIRAGSYLAPAARRAGVSEKTVYGWLAAGRGPNAPPQLAAFVAAFERAEAEAEIHIVAVVRRQIAGPGVTGGSGSSCSPADTPSGGPRTACRPARSPRRPPRPRST